MSDCPNCAAKDAAIAELVKALRAQPPVVTIFKPVQQPTPSGPTFYDRCPCNPANGGSGVCGCIRGSQTITCAVG